jgi:hypothetical protein
LLESGAGNSVTIHFLIEVRKSGFPENESNEPGWFKRTSTSLPSKLKW